MATRGIAHLLEPAVDDLRAVREETRDAQRAHGRSAAGLLIGEIEGGEPQLSALLLEEAEMGVGFGRDGRGEERHGWLLGEVADER